MNSTPEINLNYKNQRTSFYGTSVGQNSQGSIAESSTPRSLSSHRMNVSLFYIATYILRSSIIFIVPIIFIFNGFLLFIDIPSTS